MVARRASVWELAALFFFQPVKRANEPHSSLSASEVNNPAPCIKMLRAQTPYNPRVRITVNGQPESLPDRATVADLLARLKLTGSACAVEVNKSLVPKRQHDQTTLAPNDRIEVVTLVGGG